MACTGDGTKLSPYVIFKRKMIAKTYRRVPGVIVRAQAKGWMDETGVKDWLNVVWNKRQNATLRRRSLLVWDQFRAHLTQQVKQETVKLNTDLAVIPGGLISVLQPLDVCLNKPFKEKMRQKWNEWM